MKKLPYMFDPDATDAQNLARALFNVAAAINNAGDEIANGLSELAEATEAAGGVEYEDDDEADGPMEEGDEEIEDDEK